MTILLDEIMSLKRRYELVEDEAIHYLEKSPQGHLRVSKEKNRTQYYYVSDGEEKNYNGVYIRKSDILKAKQLAQKEYCEDILEVTKKRLGHIDSFIKTYKDDELGSIYSKLPIERKELITPIVLDDEEYARRWMAVEYRRKPEKIYYNEYGQKKPETEYYSKRNEKVRSKSEKLIADLLIDMGVYYRYEYPIQLKGYYDGVAYVDFYLLNVKERKEICYEHCGMSDDRGYYNDFVFRSNCYTKNGYIQGENLLYSFESSEYPVNLTVIEKQVRSVLRM